MSEHDDRRKWEPLELEKEMREQDENFAIGVALLVVFVIGVALGFVINSKLFG